MAKEALLFNDIQPGLPEDATGVLRDKQWHAAISGPERIRSNNYDPLTFWINSKVGDPFDELEYPASEQCYRMEFARNHGSWMRSGSDIICEGEAVVGDKKFSVALFIVNGIACFRAR